MPDAKLPHAQGTPSWLDMFADDQSAALAFLTTTCSAGPGRPTPRSAATRSSRSASARWPGSPRSCPTPRPGR